LDWPVLTIFLGVYCGLALGRLPGLALDRAAIAFVGAVLVLAFGKIGLAEAWAAIDVGTIALLFGMMLVSVELERAGFHERVASWIASSHVSPPRLVGLVVFVAGALSALLTNDVVCLALAPLVVDMAARRRLAPLPFLLALAAGSNVGSAATLIGNPQNMLIGERLNLDFGAYLAVAALPSALGLVATWAILVALQRGRFDASFVPPPRPTREYRALRVHALLAVLVGVVVLFLATDWPRATVALGAGALTLVSRTSRTSRTEDVLAGVDWSLLVLFAGLFVVNRAFESSGMLARAFAAARDAGVDASDPATLFLVTVPLSNLVSNVPAVMLLLPTATHKDAGAILALASTLAGNLLLVGSIANLIVADQAARLGLPFGWKEHARAGIPIACATLAIAAAWLALRSL